MKTIILFLVVLSTSNWITAMAHIPELSPLKHSVLTIVTRDPGKCGRITDTTRDIPDVQDLIEVMDNTLAYDLGTGFTMQHKNKVYVISCEHVLYKAGKIVGYDSNYKAYDLKLVGTDMFYDLAVLEFVRSEDEAKFEAVQFANSKSENNKVWGIGYWKWNGEASIQGGTIITDKEIEDAPFSDMGYIKSCVQTAGGFSGGPLINETGEIVGMNTCINAKSNTSFALKSEILEKQIHKIIENAGSTERVFCGFKLSQKESDNTVVIEDIIPNSPAAKFKDLLQNQSLKSINQKVVHNIYEALFIIEDMLTGDEINLVLKNGQKVNFTTTSLKENNLEKIALHALNKSYLDSCVENKDCAKINIDDGNVVIHHNGKKDIIKTAGLVEDRIYCIESSAHLGILIRLYGLHGHIELGKDEAHIYIKPLQFSNNNQKRVLYY